MAEFREFSPQLQQAARWALYARRVAPMLNGERAVLSLNLAGLPPARKGEVAAAKIRAGRNIPILEAMLGLDDA